MRRVFYIAIPVVAFALILSNAFFGHLLFDFYEQDINKYSIYVHLQPEWNSHPGNILFDVTNVWSDPDSEKNTYSADPSDVSSLAVYNSNQLQFQHEKPYVELRHEFSNCESNWKPMLYRYAVDVIRNRVELAQGTQLSDDPYVSVVPNVKSSGQAAAASYAQFIPVCTARGETSYSYSVSINDSNSWFDVYFVDSRDQLQNYLDSESFRYYDRDGCSARHHQSFSGVCSGVGGDSGLVIIIPDNLELSLTKIRVSLHELA